jgi:hypothetical protein
MKSHSYSDKTIIAYTGPKCKLWDGFKPILRSNFNLNMLIYKDIFENDPKQPKKVGNYFNSMFSRSEMVLF